MFSGIVVHLDERNTAVRVMSLLQIMAIIICSGGAAGAFIGFATAAGTFRIGLTFTLIVFGVFLSLVDVILQF